MPLHPFAKHIIFSLPQVGKYLLPVIRTIANLHLQSHSSSNKDSSFEFMFLCVMLGENASFAKDRKTTTVDYIWHLNNVVLLACYNSQFCTFTSEKPWTVKKKNRRKHTVRESPETRTHHFPTAIKPHAAFPALIYNSHQSASPSWRNFHSWLTWNDIIAVSPGFLWDLNAAALVESSSVCLHPESHSLNRRSQRAGIKHRPPPIVTCSSGHRSHSGASIPDHGSRSLAAVRAWKLHAEAEALLFALCTNLQEAENDELLRALTAWCPRSRAFDSFLQAAWSIQQ